MTPGRDDIVALRTDITELITLVRIGLSDED
jgi:hypothetical protein